MTTSNYVSNKDTYDYNIIVGFVSDVFSQGDVIPSGTIVTINEDAGISDYLGVKYYTDASKPKAYLVSDFNKITQGSSSTDIKTDINTDTQSKPKNTAIIVISILALGVASYLIFKSNK